jgi:Ca-activated chloride channel family protein
MIASLESLLHTLWPHWLRPFWLLILPLLGWLLWHLWHREKRSGRWQLLLPERFHAILLSGGGQNKRLPWIALGLAWTLAVLALLGPSWQRAEQPNQKRADPLVAILALTPAMLATDASPNRLQQARRKLSDLLEARRDAQTALIAYAGSAHVVVPLSDDIATTHNLLEVLKPSIMPEPGQRADLAVAKALALLDQGARGNGRILLIASELSPQERDGIRQALGGQGKRLRILGVGTDQGAPIAEEDGSLLKDERGAILLPRLDEDGLRSLASELGGSYQRMRLDDRDLRSLGLLDGPQSLRLNAEPTRLRAWLDQGYWLLLPLLLLAACAGRRGWLFCLPLLFAFPQPSQAFEFADLWLRPDQQGQRLLEEKRPAEAAKRFEDPQRQGQALYEAGDYPAASERFAHDDSAAAHYNRGNALAKDQQFEAALDAYDQALERQPDLQPALKNRALVEELLRQQRQRQQDQEQQQSPSGEQGQSQNQAQNGAQSPGQSSPGAQGSPSPSDKQNGQPGDRQPDQAQGQERRPERAGSPADKDDGKPADDTNAQRAERPGEPARPREGDPQDTLSTERKQALEQWLREIPDDPGELLRRKFLYEQQQRQENR